MLRSLLRVVISAILLSSTAVAVAEARDLTFDERVQAQKAIEEVYWRHRIWPAENSRPKPPVAEVMGDETIRAKVADYLKKSNALEKWWRRPITAEQLQAELDRMAQGTRDPAMLREIHEALGNDAYLVAETLARQTLANRLIRNWYANDDRFHGELKAKANAALAACDSAGCMKTMGGTYRETTWKLRAGEADAPRGDPENRAVLLDAEEWEKHLARLATKVGGTAEALPLMKIGSLEETAEAFVVTAVLAAGPDEVTTAATVWKKVSFDEWWAGESAAYETRIDGVSGEFELGALNLSGCAPDTWTATPIEVPDPRSYHTVVWTGTEMIVWGGNGNTGGRYNPATDTWVGTSTGANVPEARVGHTAVWTGTEMIVWGGNGDGYLDTGGRFNPATDEWVATSVGENVPAGRWNHTAVWTGTEMIVWGGDAGGSLNTGGRYNPATDTWIETSTGENVPAGRDGHTAVWTGTEMIVWGDYDITGGRYNPATNTWRTTSTGANVPGRRDGHTAVWTGTEMIVWGGYFYDGASSQHRRPVQPRDGHVESDVGRGERPVGAH